jgi:thioester reductase-like protein
VEVWAGDVERPELGLSPGEWRDLCGRVGLVVHGAARVHLLAPFEALRGSNVGGAEQVARVLEEGPAKVLVHISTLSVFAATEHPARRIDEESDPEEAVAVHGGYAQSKWLAEAWLRRRGPHVVIRPGLLTGDEETGRSAPSCQLMHLLRGLAELGCVPRGDHGALRVDVTPVDHAARVIAALLREAPREGVFHVASGRGATLAQLVEALRAEGARCEEVGAEEFLARARARRSPSVSVALLSLGRLLGARRQATDLFLLTGRELVCERTEAHTGCKAPEVSEGLLRRYVRAARGS